MAQISIDKQALLTILQGLVSINSINPTLVEGGAGESEVSAYVLQTFQQMGLNSRQDEAAPGRPNVIGRLEGAGGGPSLILNGHLDTVGVEGMEIDPFDPIIKEGRLYGRGSLDMKGGIACFIAATQAILAAGVRLKGDLILACTVDEEYESIGMDRLKSQIQATAGIITEPSGLEIVIAHKGFSWIEIETRGRAVHGSMHGVGVDAIVHMGKMLRELEKLNESFYATVAHKLLGTPTIHASLIGGGIGLSTYPDRCVLKVERRNLPHETGEDVQNEIDAILTHLSREDANFEASGRVFFTQPGADLPQDIPLVQILSKNLEGQTSTKPEFKGWAAWPEAGLLTAAGIPTVLFGPSGHDPHAPIEYVEVDSLMLCTSVLVDTIVEYCGEAR
jgi:acetylornithine deacetylase